jgi:hypothetical protein
MNGRRDGRTAADKELTKTARGWGKMPLDDLFALLAFSVASAEIGNEKCAQQPNSIN